MSELTGAEPLHFGVTFNLEDPTRVRLPPEDYEANYLAEAGWVCPVCKSQNIQGNSCIQAEGESAWQDCSCNDCHAEWNDVYNLVGISDLTVPAPEPIDTNKCEEYNEDTSHENDTGETQ